VPEVTTALAFSLSRFRFFDLLRGSSCVAKHQALGGTGVLLGSAYLAIEHCAYTPWRALNTLWLCGITALALVFSADVAAAPARHEEAADFDGFDPAVC